jgi:hypothetical protein
VTYEGHDAYSRIKEYQEIPYCVKFLLKGSDDNAQHSESLGFWTQFKFRNSKWPVNTKFRKLDLFRRIPSSGMPRRVAFVITDVSEELSASIIRVKRIGELGTKLAETSNWRKLRRNTKFNDSCHPNNGGGKLLRKVGSYKNHMAWHPRRRHSSWSQPWNLKSYKDLFPFSSK